MKLLFVNACPRLEASRTLRLARVFLSELTALRPDVVVTEHCLPRMGLKPIDRAGLALRERATPGHGITPSCARRWNSSRRTRW